MLTAALLATMNMARGQGAISHRTWIIFAAWIALSNSPNLAGILHLYIILIVTLLPTGSTLLIGIDGHKQAIWKGFVRNLPIMPALWLLHSWTGLILMMQGLLYFLCGKWKDPRATRVAEGLTGLILGLLMS